MQRNRMPDGEMDSRWKRLRKAADAEGLDGLLFYSDQVNAEAVHYAANHMVMGGSAWCYLPFDGPPVLLLSEKWDLDRASAAGAVPDVRAVEGDVGKALSDTVGLLNKLGVAGMENIPLCIWSSILAAFGDRLASATKMLDKLSRIKSDYELSLISGAVKMADAGFMSALEAARESMTDYELAAHINCVMRKMGATENFQMMDIGRGSTGMLTPDGKKIEKGDLLLLEITPAVGSITYAGQLCRTAIFGGNPEDVVREKYEILIEAMDESLALMKPGAYAKEVATKQNEIIGGYGYDKYCHPPYMRTRGHDFGLGGIMVEDDSDLVLKEGMSMVIHPNQYFPETGYLALGDQVIITKNGAKRLSAVDCKIYECGGVGE